LSYQVLIERRALKELATLPPNMAGRIGAAIDQLRTQPRPHNAKKLAGSRDQWRARVGDYRVLYEINDRAREVRIFAIGHRREIYR
jgi:mRNA interferase RelE/StbE